MLSLKAFAAFMLAVVCCIDVFAGLLDQPDKNSFRFYINADPQMGAENSTNKQRQRLNNLLERFVAEVNHNNQKKPVDFVVYNGDLVWKPNQDAFDNFTRIVAGQQVPTVLVHGNHDGTSGDAKFFKTQNQLSGYSQLNYSFTYGNWRMVVIGAPEKYQNVAERRNQLQWLKSELEKYKHHNVMLFMHYHLMPIGLTQMEYYSYWPLALKHEFLDAITQHGNVKYVFSGHVHAGVKASVKSSVTYRGTQFINSPTAVKGRPFGEEYTAFENDPSNPDYRLGYFLEVVVNDDEVSLIGHKISHPHQVVYPVQMPVFSVHSDPRFFSPESHLVANEFIKNPDFSAGQSGWYTTHRYQKDNQNAFTNLFSQGVNHQKLVAPWGDWTFDEYLETFQVVKMDPKQANQLRYHFVTPTMSSQGSGGFIRINFFLQSKRKFGTLLLHWGKQENQLKFSDKAWAYNATGDRANYDYLNREIKAGHTLSMPLAFEHAEGKQLLQLNLNALLPHFGRSGLSVKNISHMTLAHGVWTIIKITGEPIASELKMDAIHLTHNKKMNAAPITLNGKIIPLDGKDRKTPYGSTKPRGQ